jgi:hypothetical protein
MLNFIVSFDLDPFFSYLSVDGLDLSHFLHEEMSFGDREKFFVDILIIAETVHGFNFIKVINFIQSNRLMKIINFSIAIQYIQYFS